MTVVGGGPAGTYSARLLASSGRDVTVLEEHLSAGQPSHCAGVVTSEVLQSFGVRPKFLGSISAADVILPDGTVIETSKKMPYAFIIDRCDFDKKLAEMAEDAGVTIKYGAHCKRYEVGTDGVTVETNLGQFRSDILIGADGQNSVLAASLGNNLIKSYVRGIQVDLKYRSDDPEKMLLRLGNEVAPGFFSWQLPLGDITRIGIGVGAQYGPPKPYLDRLLDSLGLADKERIATYSGKIPMGSRRTTFSDRLLLIGDAAGQVKPVSGGGLYPISKAAPRLKETVDRAYSMGMFSSSVLSLYERGWKRDLGKSLSHGMKLREYYDRLDDEQLCEFGHLFSRPDLAAILSDIDMDNPGNVLRPMFRKKGVKSLVFKTYLRSRA